jgi:DnaJ-domain-containing protein 1
MTDYFALLEEPRRPWIVPESLKNKFLELSASHHPDHQPSSTTQDQTAANERFSELNAAYQCLREDRERLAHLIELERGTRPQSVERIPAGQMELFFEIGQTCQQAKSFLSREGRAASPLLKAQTYEKRLDWVDRLQALQQKLNVQRHALQVELESMNTIWNAAPPPESPGRAQALPLDRLEEIYRLLSYLSRGSGQVQEQLLQLSI